ncbi:GRF-interacting factor 1-like isoform X2 [Typha latifolia]|uniref:GRF-interacting factor 1-like isoform X2 n=1 Tax=Typha latifolia TaxID=4733 RepID=UPI003C2F35BA
MLQYLDENKQLILAILDNQNSGKAEECAENQAKLQRNLMYLAAIADSQPQVPTIAQYPPTAMMQSGSRYMQHQQVQQQMTPQSLMAARPSMLYTQSPMSVLQQQQQQAALHSQLGMSSGGSGGFTMLHGEPSVGGNGTLAAGMFPGFGRSGGAAKREAGSGLPTEGHGGHSGGQGGNASDPMYLKGSEGDAN